MAEILKNNLTLLPVPKLYLLTNDDKFELLYRKLETALATGLIGLLQIRRKQVLAMPNGQAELYNEAIKIVALAKKYNVPVVINDDITLAAKLGVGVHLGQQDGSISDAKQLLAPKQIIGRTCHGDVALVKQAQSDGANYAAMGAIFASTTKPNAETVSRQQLIDGCEQTINKKSVGKKNIDGSNVDENSDKNIDICVIGGLTAENIGQLAGLPIAYIAVVGDIMDLPIDSIAERCQQWQHALSNNWQLSI